MPLQATSGAASYDAYGGGVAVVPTYIEDVFSTYLYTGTGASQTITNNIDLSTKGGLTWIKGRSGATGHRLTDTARGVTKSLESNSTAAEATESTGLTAFGTTGFTIGADADYNTSAATYASWTFRKQPKFFDVVTFTTDASGNATVSHSLGSTPGCILVKSTSGAQDWKVYHRGTEGGGFFAVNRYLELNSTSAALSSTAWISVSSTQIGFPGNRLDGSTSYVAYLFAHDAGGFGLTGTDNVISCGSYVGTGAVGNAVTLGYEPQWLMVKNITSAFDWIMYDNMRGMPASATNTGETKFLRPNTSDAEAGGGTIIPTATGFQANTTYQGANFSGETYIYIAIRRGPMKVPTTGTSVYNAIVRNGTAANATVTGVGFPVDLIYTSLRPAGTHNPVLSDRLRGAKLTLGSRGTQAEQSEPAAVTSFASMDGVSLGDNTTDFWNGFNSESGLSYINWFFKRAPSVFDIVCYTGTGSTRTVSHNLAAVPQLMITKVRSSAGYGWFVYPLDPTKYMELNSTSGTGVTSSAWNDTAPTASVFTVGPADQTNLSGATMVAYLFATCAGVSKVFSYTGNGSSQTINCGFTAGARFVLIKRTDSTGDWYVWDTTRGIVAGNDPHLSLNTTTAEVTTDDTIDTDNTGFVVNQVTATNQCKRW